MILLVIIAVGLLTLSSINLRASSRSQAEAAARSNARMALNIAIAQLQLTIGPDQRATASADLGEGAPAFRYNPSDKAPLTKPQNGTRHWTAAWGQLDDPTNPGWQQNPTLLDWLVSGNQASSFAMQTNATDRYQEGGQFGLITNPPSAKPAFGPDSVVAGLTAATTGGATNLKIGAADAALLVGPNSVGAGNLSGYVVAPLVEIKSPQTPNQAGRYAYWVGDEGVKARANLIDPWATPSSSDQARAGYSSPQRYAIERMATTSDPASAPWETLYARNDSRLARVVSLPQLPLSSPDPSAANNSSKARFHDLTAHSYSVLADQRSGGLKRELDRELVTPSSTSPAPGSPLFRRETTDTTSGIALQSYRVPPTWGRLANWYNGSRGPVSRTLTPTVLNSGGSGEIPIGPMISWAEIGFGAYYQKNPAEPSYQGVLRLFPRVAIWNPYNANLAARRYEIGLALIKTGTGIKDMSFILRDATKLTAVKPDEASRIPGSDWRMSNGVLNDSDAEKQFITFTIDSPVLAPGETRWFSLNGVATYNGTNLLTPGDRATSCVEVAGLKIPGLPPQLVWGHRFYPWGGDAEMYLREDGKPPVRTPSFPTRGTLAPSSDHRFFQYVYGLNLGGAGNFTGQLRDPELTVSTSSKPEEFSKTYNFLGEGSGAPSASPQFKAVWATHDISRNFVRWLANSNPRATLAGHSGAGNDGGAFLNSASWRLGDKNATHRFNFANILTDSGLVPNPPVIVNGEISSGMRAYTIVSGKANRTTLFDMPIADVPFTSIANLQQAHLSDFSGHPAFAIGNSLADPRLPRGVSFQRSGSGDRIPIFRSAMHGNYHHYDISYRLNASLWDRYFFSSLFAGGTSPVVSTFPAPNSLMVPYASHGKSTPSLSDSDLKSPDKAAAKLILAGGFNVNSTSEQAWLALLASRRGVRYDPQTGLVANPPAADWTPISRLHRPTADNRDPTKGYRYLTGSGNDAQVTGQKGNEQLSALAKAIVAEVKARGPFVSLSNFVNRELVPAPTPNATGAPLRQDNSLKGALQAALDRDTRNLGTTANLNINRNPSLSPTAYRFTETGWGGWDMADTPAAPEKTGPGFNLSYNIGEGGNNGESLRGIVGTATTDSLANPALSKHAGLPGFITQADLLSAIGSAITARSDTFTIRTYGEVRNPTTSEVTGRAWLEAVVQRVPDYIDSTDTLLRNGSATEPQKTSLINRRFGRRIEVVSFRWLTPADL